MIISLIVTCSIRTTELERLFNSIWAQKSDEFVIEVIFIDQGKYDKIPPFNNKPNFVFKHFHVGRLSLSQARNIGLREAKGRIVAFPDDDCWYPQGLLTEVLNIFASSPGLSGISTAVFDPDIKKSYGGRPLSLVRRIDGYTLFSLPISVGIFLRKEVLDSLDSWFDESLGAGTPLGSGEETDLLFRILRGGGKLDYRGDLLVYHPVLPYTLEDLPKVTRYSLGFGYLHGRVLKRGEFRVLPFFLLVTARSLGGSIYYREELLRRIYSRRLLGIWQGLFRGVLS